MFSVLSDLLSGIVQKQGRIFPVLIREMFPRVPMMALTASATNKEVDQDIDMYGMVVRYKYITATT